MYPNCADVAQDIKDVFLEWTDDGIELEDVELCVLGNKFGIEMNMVL
jgi:hypothetical protein